MWDSEKQREFQATVKQLDSEFPKQVNSGSPFDRWNECQKYIEQARTLAKTFQDHSKDQPPIETLPELGELLKNCVWHLFEFGRLDDAQELLEIAYETVPDKESALYAHLLNSAAVIYFERNDLKHCQKCNDESLRIREKVLAPDDFDLMTSYYNLGNLASAQGRYDTALEYFAKIEPIRIEAGEEAVVSLGMIHMMTGRVHFLRKDYAAASERYDMAEEIFKINPGPSSQLMAHLIYAFGNLKYAQGDFTTAKELYHKGHTLSYKHGLSHNLTASFDYKFGVVEAQLENYYIAMERLEKALVVVQKYKAKGDTARILRKQAIVIRQDPLSTSEDMREADTLMEKAENIRAELTDGEDRDPSLPEDLVYDNLVCGHLR